MADDKLKAEAINCVKHGYYNVHKCPVCAARDYEKSTDGMLKSVIQNEDWQVIMAFQGVVKAIADLNAGQRSRVIDAVRLIMDA